MGLSPELWCLHRLWAGSVRVGLNCRTPAGVRVGELTGVWKTHTWRRKYRVKREWLYLQVSSGTGFGLGVLH